MSEPHDPIREEFRLQMNVVAGVLDDLFNPEGPPRRIGFALHIWEFDNHAENRVNYIANCKRAEMIDALQEWIDRNRAQLARET
jgi:hypothetical protein